MKNLKIISESFKYIGGLDDFYTLYQNGEVLHEYDMHIYPGGYNHSEILNAEGLGDSLKMRLFESACTEYKMLVKKILKLNF